MYVAVKGGERAIDNAHRLLASRRRGDTSVAELSVPQVRQQLPLAVARVMSEGSLYDEKLAALAIKQAAGDLMEAIFLLRAYRTTLPRFGASEPLDTTKMQLQRHISATFKDLPAASCSARPSITPTACWTSPCWPRATIQHRKRPAPINPSRVRACWISSPTRA